MWAYVMRMTGHTYRLYRVKNSFKPRSRVNGYGDISAFAHGLIGAADHCVSGTLSSASLRRPEHPPWTTCSNATQCTQLYQRYYSRMYTFPFPVPPHFHLSSQSAPVCTAIKSPLKVVLAVWPQSAGGCTLKSEHMLSVLQYYMLMSQNRLHVAHNM